jgi:hypothetical protein
VDVYGTATGPVGIELSVVTNPVFASPEVVTAPAWTAPSELQWVRRGANDPATTTWALRFPDFWLSDFFNQPPSKDDTVYIRARLFSGPPGTGRETSVAVTCRRP